jgi:hypothetical protein
MLPESAGRISSFAALALFQEMILNRVELALMNNPSGRGSRGILKRADE